MRDPVSEFTEQHGEYVDVCETFGNPVVRLFADGARMVGIDRDIRALLRHDPPAEKWELLSARITFLETKLGIEEKNFHQFQSECLEQLDMHRSMPLSCPPPGENCVAQLEAGAERIKSLQSRLEPLYAEWEESPQAVGEAKAQQRNAERVEAMADLDHRIRSVSY